MSGADVVIVVDETAPPDTPGVAAAHTPPSPEKDTPLRMWQGGSPADRPPPGSGKTTAARQAPPGWAVYDWDDWPDPADFDAALSALGQDPQARAVVVRACVTAADLAHTVATIQPTAVYRVDPGDPAVCAQRIQSRQGGTPPTPYQAPGDQRVVPEWRTHSDTRMERMECNCECECKCEFTNAIGDAQPRPGPRPRQREKCFVTIGFVTGGGFLGSPPLPGDMPVGCYLSPHRQRN